MFNHQATVLSNIEFEILSDEKRIRFNADLPSDSALRRVSFTFFEDEFGSFANDPNCKFNDIFNQLQVSGDRITLFRMELPTYSGYGTVEVPFVNVYFPLFARRIILGYAVRCWREKKDVRLKVSDARWNRWEKNYSQGSGTVIVDINDRAVPLYEKNLVHQNFKENVDRLRNIAGSSTRAFFHNARVNIYLDSPNGFYWEAFTPRGKRIMNGGLINHGSDVNPDWSIHT